MDMSVDPIIVGGESDSPHVQISEEQHLEESEASAHQAEKGKLQEMITHAAELVAKNKFLDDNIFSHSKEADRVLQAYKILQGHKVKAVANYNTLFEKIVEMLHGDLSKVKELPQELPTQILSPEILKLQTDLEKALKSEDEQLKQDEITISDKNSQIMEGAKKIAESLEKLKQRAGQIHSQEDELKNKDGKIMSQDEKLQAEIAELERVQAALDALQSSSSGAIGSEHEKEQSLLEQLERSRADLKAAHKEVLAMSKKFDAHMGDDNADEAKELEGHEEMRVKLQLMEAQLKEMKAMKEQVETKFELRGAKNTELRKQIVVGQARIAELEKEIKGLHTEIANHDVLDAKHVNHVARLQSQIATLQESQTAKGGASNEQLKDLQAKLRELTSLLSNAKKDHPLVRKLKEQLLNKREEIEGIRKSLVELNQMEDEKTRKLRELRASVATLKDEIHGKSSSQGAEGEAMKIELARLRQQLKDLQERLQDEEGRESHMETEKQEVKIDMSAFEGAASADKDALRKLLSKAQSENDKDEIDKDALRMLLTKAQAESLSNQLELRDAKAAVKEAEATLSQMKAQVAYAKADADDAKADAQDAKADAEDARTETDDAKAKQVEL